MFWNKWIRLPRTIRFRLASAFTLASLLAAVLTILIMLLLGNLFLAHGIDDTLRKQWAHYAETPDLLEEVPPDLFVAHLQPDGRTVITLSESVGRRTLLFMKPQYGRRGQRTDAAGFWTQTVETGKHRTRYRVCAKRLPDETILAVAQSHAPFDRASLIMLAGGGISLLLMAFLLVLFAGLIAQRLLRGFGQAADVVDAMAAGDFSLRMPTFSSGEEVERLTRSVNKMAENTEHLLADLRAVTDNIAHDLRTPVTRLRGRAELALYTESDAKVLAGEVAEECDSMLELINALLEIARVGHNIGIGQGEPTDVTALLEDLRDLFSVAAEEKGLTLAYHRPDAPIVCRIEAPLLRRALSNLLDNAIKFTPTGGSVTLSVMRLRDTLRIEVIDTGCGIAPEEQRHVFDRFYRVAGDRTLPGFGLGLAMVQAIAQAFGGQVTLRSALGQGSCFALELPFREA